ncbi:MAG: YqjK-like family protein [Rubrivivax sp.]|nr:YqjK-like family protein [Rubrivivax sp.]
MSPRREALVARREQLLARSAMLRNETALRARAFEGPLSWADWALQSMAWLRHNPAWPAGAVGLLAVVRPRRVWRWTRRGFAAWRLWRRARPYASLLAQGWQRSRRDAPRL